MIRVRTILLTMSVMTVGIVQSNSKSVLTNQDKWSEKVLQQLDAKQVKALCKQLNAMSDSERKALLQGLSHRELITDEINFGGEYAVLLPFGSTLILTLMVCGILSIYPCCWCCFKKKCEKSDRRENKKMINMV